MPILVPQETGNEIAQRIFQQSLDSSEIPSGWKMASKVPIFKKGNKTKLRNYLPVSLTAAVSKMLEYIIVAQIMDHLDEQKILHTNQHRFRAQHSYESQLLFPTDVITRNMSQGRQVDMVILDLKKAFIKSVLGKCHIIAFGIQHFNGLPCSGVNEVNRSLWMVKPLSLPK